MHGRLHLQNRRDARKQGYPNLRLSVVGSPVLGGRCGVKCAATGWEYQCDMNVFVVGSSHLSLCPVSNEHGVF